MARKTKLIVSALALGAVAFGGGMLSTAAPMADAATIPICTISKSMADVYGNQWHMPGSAASSVYCQVGTAQVGSMLLSTQVVQNAYNSDVYYLFTPKITKDGYYGTNTATAVKKIQAYHGVTQDGIYGPVTCSNKMMWPKQKVVNGFKYIKLGVCA